uniref:Large ribosomal subunit protein P2 n=1 Tax=Callithrix jacchus TaxID=9483 RepID=A0A8I4A209_CALJA
MRSRWAAGVGGGLRGGVFLRQRPTGPATRNLARGPGVGRLEAARVTPPWRPLRPPQDALRRLLPAGCPRGQPFPERQGHQEDPGQRRHRGGRRPAQQAAWPAEAGDSSRGDGARLSQKEKKEKKKKQGGYEARSGLTSFGNSIQVISELNGKNIEDVIAQGIGKLASVPAGGAVAISAAPGSAAPAAGSAPAAAEEKKDEKKEESEESDDDMGFGLFD